MVRANSAVTIAGPRQGTMSSRTFGARAAIFSIKRRHQKFDREIGHHQAKTPLAAGGIEIVGNEKPAHLIKRLRQRPAQRLGARRQFHAGADPHQQRIAEHVAQPLQRVARGRLRQADPHRGAADIGFQQQRVQRDQKVEIERAKFIS